MQTVREVKVKNQVVLVRTDFNVPIKDGKIVSDFRLRAALPTIKYLHAEGAKKIVLISHFGRPAGKRVPELSLQIVAKRLQKLLPEFPVNFIDDVSGPDVEAAFKRLPQGGILLLENLRFYSGEEANSDFFINEIIDSVHPDLFVQEGFAVTHRAHASTVAITNHLPSVAGLLLDKEITTLSHVLKSPKRPLLLILGGAKVTDKQSLIAHFAKFADQIAIGGKIAADGYTTKDPKIYVADDFDQDATGAKLDIGPLSTAHILELAKNSQTVIWNGPLGKIEDPAYTSASTALAELLGESPNITSIICGGDTVGFIETLLVDQPQLRFSLLSTGGGATLEFLSGASLPGLAKLDVSAYT